MNPTTLAASLADGRLPHLNTPRLRATFAMASTKCVNDCRRAILALFERVCAYYRVVAYSGPGYVFGRVESEACYAERATPSAKLGASMSIDHPTTGAAIHWVDASAMCLRTAYKVAAWELGKALPEAAPLFETCAMTAYRISTHRRVCGLNWESSRRRIGTTGIRKALAYALPQMQSIYVTLQSSHYFPIAICAAEWPTISRLIEADKMRHPHLSYTVAVPSGTAR
jgi:hypothetical protein